jgi:hypothetical protein
VTAAANPARPWRESGSFDRSRTSITPGRPRPAAFDRRPARLSSSPARAHL